MKIIEGIWSTLLFIGAFLFVASPMLFGLWVMDWLGVVEWVRDLFIFIYVLAIMVLFIMSAMGARVLGVAQRQCEAVEEMIR